MMMRIRRRRKRNRMRSSLGLQIMMMVMMMIRLVTISHHVSDPNKAIGLQLQHQAPSAPTTIELPE